VLNVFLKQPDVRVVSICDVRKTRRDTAKRIVDKQYDNTDCTTFRDMTEFYEANTKMDAVMIATGDRWHTMASIVAAKAGKDIYCEKPLSLTIQESRAVEKAVNRYGRIFQAGTQRRNIGNFQLAAKLVHDGKLGVITELHANTLHPATIHDWLPAQPEPPKDEVDWDLWLGPCPWRPYNSAYVRGGNSWHGYYDFHGGGILEWGTHTVDLCQWANFAEDTVPTEYRATYANNGDKTARVEAHYANGVKLVMRSDGWLGLGSCSVRSIGEDGWVETGEAGRMEVSADALRKELKFFGTHGTTPDNHVREFLDCVKSRKNPASHAVVAANAHIAAHCAKIVWDLSPAKKPADEESLVLKFDPLKEEFVGGGSEVDVANRLRSRAMRSPWRC
jgi:predicted dehydrogenase